MRSFGEPTKIALVYPNTYHVGMSSLGFQIVYQILNTLPKTMAERFFMDESLPTSMESGLEARRFDIIAFSISYELDFLNVLQFLDRNQLPIHARERNDGDPLVVAAGVGVHMNRHPLAPFVDAFVFGDGEQTSVCLAQIHNDCGQDRRELLSRLANSPGFVVTEACREAYSLEAGSSGARGGHATKREFSDGIPTPKVSSPKPSNSPEQLLVASLEAHDHATQIYTEHTEFSGMGLVDLARGCPHFCTFCYIGHNLESYRCRSLEQLRRLIDKVAAMSDRIGLVSSALGAHPDIDAVCLYARSRNLKVAFSSLRVEEITPVMLRSLAESGQRMITIAPETGSLRLRRLLGKRLSDERCFEVVGEAADLGMQNVKLYTMIGLPSETDEEALAIVDFVKQVKKRLLRAGKPRGRLGEVVVNLGIFTPKPNIPLARFGLRPLPELRRRARLVTKALQRMSNVKVNVSSPTLAAAQTFLSMGREDAAAYLETVFSNGGDWKRGLQSHRDAFESYVATEAAQKIESVLTA
ncbi:MAG: radical SAM protein [bacterium]